MDDTKIRLVCVGGGGGGALASCRRSRRHPSWVVDGRRTGRVHIGLVQKDQEDGFTRVVSGWTGGGVTICTPGSGKCRPLASAAEQA